MFGEDAVKIPKIKTRWRLAAQKAALPFSERTHSYNSRSAQELGKWAETQGSGKKFHDAVYRTYFVERKNIAQTTVLMEVVESIDLSAESAETALETRAFRQVVDADWARSEKMNIELVPTCVFNGKALENPQKYELLAQFLIENNVNRRNTVS
jgi:predicted DsbA family dithiol-disulfide isomerase